jgi:pimeloyl-ACP methyl ester carboxylesterase
MSLGSWIALDYCLEHPDSIKGLCLITTSGIVPPKSAFFLRILPLLLLGEWGVKRINRLVHGNVPVDPEVEAFSLLTARWYRQLLEPLPIFSDKQLAGISFPLLFIGGTEDVLIDTKATAERLSRQVPDAQIIVLEGYGHAILDQGDRIMNFFRNGFVS